MAGGLNPFAAEFVPAESVRQWTLPAKLRTEPNPEQTETATSNGVTDEAEELEFEQLMFSPQGSGGCSTPSRSLTGPEPASPATVTRPQAASGDAGPSHVADGQQALQCSSSQESLLSEVLEDKAKPLESKQRVGPNDFELLRVVGQGAFGKVFQVRKKDTGEIYAMKVMRKEKVLEKQHGEYVKAEREILTAVFHPYIVTMRYSFQTSTKLYLVLDFINGGHLFFQLYRQGIFSEELARLYTAEIVLAISHLHSLGFVHRDLKPENVLLDSEGHIKVTDFGLAKGNMSDEERTNSFIGTMEYMAPEIIAGRGHGKAVDWWSVGILLYEMLCGVPPYRAKSRTQLQKQILGAKLKMPPYLSTEAQSLLKALLVREPSKRLGYGPSGSENVKLHAFFRPISWTCVLEHQMPSPFKPTVQHNTSVENFDKIWTDQAAVDSPPGSPGREAALVHPIFDGFTYVAPSFLSETANGGKGLPSAVAGEL